jgi:hypothetical protein
MRLKRRFKRISKFDETYVRDRVNYYNKLTEPVSLGDHAVSIQSLRLKDYKTTYFLDSYKFLRFFNKNLECHLRFGDITTIPEVPSLLKSRPISGDNANSVLLKLNKIRHFHFVHDHKKYAEKKDLIVWRGNVTDPKKIRVRFFEKFFGHPMCDIGYTNNWGKNFEWAKPKMTIDEQLDFKFILCLEGVDVATNLKWAMSSNSLAVMPKPKYETWFMEGALVPGFHYVLIQDDFSDLGEKMRYYIDNPGEAKSIIQNAHQHVSQFLNKEREDLISLLVLDKYFRKTHQLG